MRIKCQKVIDKLDHSLVARIEKAIETEQRIYNILPSEDIEQYEDNFERLEIAREERQVVRVLYRSPKNKKAKLHLLQPYGLFFRGSDWRLLAKSDVSEEKLRHPSQKIINRLDDGSVVVQYRVPKDEFMWWILSLGSNVEVLQPEELQSEILHEIQEIFGIYQ